MTGLRIVGLTGALGALLTAYGCGGSSNNTTAPDPVTYPQKTETYAGTILPGETKAFHFPVTNPGSLDSAITALAPLSTLTMGLQLGGWDPLTETCSKSLFNDAARINVALSGTPQSAGEYCVAIYDVGNLQAPSDFTLTVLHY